MRQVEEDSGGGVRARVVDGSRCRWGGTPLALAVGRALFLWALDPMMPTRPDTGAILDANPAACRTLRLPLEELLERGREGVRDPDDGRWAAGLRHRAYTGSFVGELSMRRGDGSTFPAQVSSAVFQVGVADLTRSST